ncbi:16S rRNA (uracil(1498)-N(3))-methyltransferase, partial [Raoultella planticola]|uniref:16S rRNA (uracil(1498)-N(3))-methyltransferase n=1 Tax=Raoultella planticola TaxID=575 RepID=UPI0013D76C4F
DDLKPLPAVLAALPDDRLLVFCDEDAPVANPAAALQPFAVAPPPLALLIGPEGGFSPEERAMIIKRPRSIALSLGPR